MTNSLKLEFDTKFLWQVLFFLCACAIIFASSDEVLATGAGSASDLQGAGGSNDAIGNGLCKVVAALSGSIAKSVATVAIIGVAGGLLMGKLQWTTAMTVAVGVIIIFSAGKIVGWVSGSAGVTAATDCK